MNAPDLHELLARIFPDGIVHAMAGGIVEVNGLRPGTLPAHCRIIESARDASGALPRNEFFLVRADGVLLYLRVCTGVTHSRASECALLLGAAQTRSECQALAQMALKELAAFPGALRSARVDSAA